MASPVDDLMEKADAAALGVTTNLFEQASVLKKTLAAPEPGDLLSREAVEGLVGTLQSAAACIELLSSIAKQLKDL